MSGTPSRGIVRWILRWWSAATVTPSSRTYVVQAETRVQPIDSETRVLAIRSETRVYPVR